MIKKMLRLMMGLILMGGLIPSVSNANDLVQLLRSGETAQVIQIIQQDDFSTHYRGQVVSLILEAAQSGNQEILESLVQRGVRIAHPRIQDSQGRSPLSLALKNHQVDAAQVIMAAGADLRPAIEAGSLDLLKKLIAAGQLDSDRLHQPLRSGEIPFSLAESFGHADLANFILALKFLKSTEDFSHPEAYESLRFVFAKRFRAPSEEKTRLLLQFRMRLVKILQGESWSPQGATYDWVMPTLQVEDTSVWINDEQLLQMDLRHAGFEIFYRVLYPRFFEGPEINLKSLLELKQDLERKATLGKAEYQEIRERVPAQRLRKLFLDRLSLTDLPEDGKNSQPVLELLKAKCRQLESPQAVFEFLEQLNEWWKPLMDAKLIGNQKELNQAFFEAKKQQMVKKMERDFGLTSLDHSLNPEVEGTCLICLDESRAVSSPCSNHPAAWVCHACAERGLREVTREKQAQLRCLSCTSAHPMSPAFFERAGCKPELVDELRELEVRQEILKRYSHFQFCHREGCVGGKTFGLGETKTFDCKICSFSGCLDCGKEGVSAAHFRARGRCKGIQDSSELYVKLIRRGAEAPITIDQLRAWGFQGRKGPQAGEFFRGYLKSLSERHPKGGQCPLCAGVLGDVHAIEDHFYDGKYRPCPHCGMMIEKTSRAEGGECPNLTCGNPRCRKDFNFGRGLRDRTPLEGRMEYALRRGLSPWFPGQEPSEVHDQGSGAEREGGSPSRGCSVM